MLYNTGTIAINGNTATGTGTNWTAPASQVRAGQTIIVMSNPVQLFQISSVNSATSLTVTPVASPALSGQKYGILVSDNISVDGLAQAMSQLIKEYDENIGAWETFATTSANQTITVTINGASVNIPGIGALARKGANSDITELKGLTTALSIAQGGTGATKAEDARTNLGLGNSATRDVGAAAGTVAAGDDSRLNSVDQKVGGKITSPITVQPGINGNPGFAINSGDNGGGGLMNNGISLVVASGYNPNTGNYVNLIKGTWYTGEWSFGGARGGGANFDNVTLNLKGSNQEGMVTWVFHSNGAATGNWVTASDERIKENVTVIADPLMKMQQLRGVEWDRLDTPAHGYGFIAQEVEKVFPDAVKSYGKTTLRDGSEIEDVKSVDTFGVAAALHHEAILALMVKIDSLKTQVDNFLLAK
ncbi:TPA: tail fiber domain-containing protein [Escherichia coli]|nr:tail fiber domain-containing protein [Escherichia coli]HAY5589722.1 tail fiber domain-containing protein [Escherichia coli]